MSAPIYHDVTSNLRQNVVPVELPHTGNTKITIVKAKDYALLSRRERLLKNVDYMETQVNALRNQSVKLGQMIRDMRDEVSQLSIEG